MSAFPSQHSTVVLSRTYDAPIGRVFAAVAEPLERQCVFAARAEVAFEFQRLDPRVGGRDTFRFGTGGGFQFRGETVYQDIVPQRRIVATDTVYAGKMRVWVGLTTLEFATVKQRTLLKVTAHTVWLDGEAAVDGADCYYRELLERVARYLESD